jgi:hypothetical protein
MNKIKRLEKEIDSLKARLQQHEVLNLRLGDRVMVYPEYEPSFKGVIFNLVNGKVFVIEDGFYSGHSDNPFLPSQCKRLRKVKR